MSREVTLQSQSVTATSSAVPQRAAHRGGARRVAAPLRDAAEPRREGPEGPRQPVPGPRAGRGRWRRSARAPASAFRVPAWPG